MSILIPPPARGTAPPSSLAEPLSPEEEAALLLLFSAERLNQTVPDCAKGT